MADKDTNMRVQTNWTSNLLYAVYVLFIVLSIAAVYKIIKLQFFWHPEEELLEYFGTVTSESKVIPERGDILSYDGKILATSEDLYQISMDCTIQRDYWLEKNKPENEEKWRDKAQVLSSQLAELFQDKTADEYYRMIIENRESKTKAGRKKVKIGTEIDYQTLQKVKSFALFNEGSNYGGLIVDINHKRLYPYGSLARKAIGEVKNNHEITNDLTGIEGKYNVYLHGKDGRIALTRTDSRQNIQDYTRVSEPAENGLDVRTTINIEFQNIADKALRKVLEENEAIAGGCVMIMETKTGAIRAMANLRREDNGNIGETYNYVIWQANNPGSVFKAVTLMALLDKGAVKSLDDMVPTFGGNWTYRGQRLPLDDYILPYKYPTGEISIGEALAISSNHVFRYLAATEYGEHPEQFIQKLYDYKLMEKYDFDIDGLATPIVRKPSEQGWSPIDLPLIAMGYSVNVTPLHVITFYNSIANGGRMMKPYMVESLERDGKIIQKMDPVVLNGAMCKPETIDTLKRGLLMVTEHNGGDYHRGTGLTSFKGSLTRVAGKTGTSRIEFANQRDGKTVYTREDSEGRHVHQGSFVGFFPADDPQYTVMSVTYTKPTFTNVYGAVSAKVVREISDKIFLLSPEWGEPIRSSARMPKMERAEAGESQRGIVPEVQGLGLSEAIFAIENSGYSCSYSGTGHVARQTPAAGSKLAQGSTVRITLE